MTFQQISIIGSGVLGSQIALQAAYHGFQVTLYDINQSALDNGREMISNLTEHFKIDLNASDDSLEKALSRLSYTTDLHVASQQADLIVEAIPEVADLKISLYQELNTLAPKETVFVTNTSTFLPSLFAEATGRPEKFLALHFANRIWVNNTAEVMGTEFTDSNVFESVVTFAKDIGMVALPLYKEQPGYILNSLLVPFIEAGEHLLVNAVADHETIDKTWMLATKAPRGPFGILDVVGLNTAYNIALSKQDTQTAAYLKEHYIDKGHLGMQSGQGFYTYPNPAYLADDFLTK